VRERTVSRRTESSRKLTATEPEGAVVGVAFMLTTLVVVVTPGPGVLHVVLAGRLAVSER
jgi:hypothetical protein